MKKRYVVAGILAAAGLICGGIAYYQYYQDAHAGQEYEKIKEKVVTEEPKKPEETQKSTVEIPIDFQTLQNMNPDIYAWIKVPGTVIDYPIVQSGTDNSYYLNHSVEHDENKAGAIFTEDYNTKTFEDPNTVIYGHGMANGSMFDGLHQYMDRDFFDQNKEVIIYMPDKILHYQIFAAYLYDNRHLLQSFNFDNKDIYQAYLDMVFGIRDMKSKELTFEVQDLSPIAIIAKVDASQAVTNTTGTSPKTGVDSTNTVPFAGAAVVLLGAAAVVAFRKKNA